MIVQTAPQGQPHFVILQVDHARMAGQFAEAFGNERFAAPAPREPLIYAVAHHDEGWEMIDAEPGLDPETGLPYNLTKTPLPRLIRTGAGSPDFNEAHHPYSGLISSMHTWGLYHGRYGLSDFLFIDRIPPELKGEVQQMLDGEIGRQERLKDVMHGMGLDAYLSKAAIFRNYKLLQFFDTLALYFHTTHAEARGEATFLHVPTDDEHDLTLTIRPGGEGAYLLSPWPFAEGRLEVEVLGRPLRPRSAADDVMLRAMMHAIPKQAQRYTLLAG